jgi:hypothetical protein
LDISETGLRRFLILDTESGQITTHRVECPLLYFDESFLLLPTEAGMDNMLEDIQRRISDWRLPEGWSDRVQVRLNIHGVSEISRQKIFEEVSQAFSGFKFFRDQGPDMTNLFHDKDPDRADISTKFTNWLKGIDWSPEQPGDPSEDQILQAAFKIIYGVD